MEDFKHAEKVKAVLLAMQRHCWEQGEAEHAFTELGDHETVIRMARETINRSLADGRVGIISADDERTVTDPCSCGQAIHLALKLTNEPLFRQAHERLLAWTLNEAPRNEQGILYHLTDSPEFWADSLYMLPPFLADAGYFEEAVKQFKGYWNVLFDDDVNLLHTFWHDGQKKFLRNGIHRGIANGYAMIAAIRMLNDLPEHMDGERSYLIEKTELLIKGMLHFEHEDSIFYDALDSPGESFVAMNAAQMLAYTLYKGITAGWLEDNYAHIAHKLRLAMESRVDHLGYVNDVCGAPTFRKPGNAPNGQSFYILMQCAYAEYKQTGGTR